MSTLIHACCTCLRDAQTGRSKVIVCIRVYSHWEGGASLFGRHKIERACQASGGKLKSVFVSFLSGDKISAVRILQG